jgi:hypothetical protein
LDIWLGTLNEILSYIVVNILFLHNILNYNLFLIIDALLLFWQFEKWGLFGNNKKIAGFIYFVFSLFWMLENIFISKFNAGFNSYFRIFSSSLIVIMSIAMLNKIIMIEKKPLIRDSIFIVSGVLIVLFTYAFLTEAFIIYGVNMNAFFSTNIYFIFNFVNFGCNILFALAIWYMPKKQAFSLQY